MGGRGDTSIHPRHQEEAQLYHQGLSWGRTSIVYLCAQRRLTTKKYIHLTLHDHTILVVQPRKARLRLTRVLPLSVKGAQPFRQSDELAAAPSRPMQDKLDVVEYQKQAYGLTDATEVRVYPGF